MRNALKRLVIVIVILSTASLTMPAVGQRLGRIDRLERWIAAINRHEPGALDDAVQEVATWDAADLATLASDVATLVSLVREPAVLTFYQPVIRTPPRQITWADSPRSSSSTGQGKPLTYDAPDLRRLRVLAASLMNAGPGRDNALLKRGAMLHADVEVLDPAASRGRGGVVGLERVMIRLDDGRQTGIESVANHWAFARRLLDRVTSHDQSNGRFRGPEGDSTVRLWYVATAAFMEATGSIETEHFDRALELFPMDPQVLFLSAALHEVLAGPRRQSAFRNADILTRVRFQVGSEREELGVADRLYRRALEADPDAAEARIRYARVLGLRGRHAEAVAELTKVARQKEPLLEYYASLFLGGEYEALGRDDEARDAYQRAGSLFPRAQSPRVGLSRLGGTMEQRQATREALLALTADAEPRYDPWWEYEQVQARGVTDLLAGLNAVIAVIKEPR